VAHSPAEIMVDKKILIIGGIFVLASGVIGLAGAWHAPC
jgi:hypothetical protein